MSTGKRVTVVGGGIVGLACAAELVRGGHRVTVLDPDPGGGASRAAAGMIAPAGEAWFGEEALLTAGLESAALWPAFASQLGVELFAGGTVLVGYDAADLAVVRRSADLLAGLGLVVTEDVPTQLEPTVSDRACGAFLLHGDLHVDPRAVVAALLGLVGDRVVRRFADRDALLADPGVDVVVDCTGSPPGQGIRPVRGDILRVCTDDPPQRVVRGLVHGEPIYVVPRPGEVVIGATSEERSGPAFPTLGGVARLLLAARMLVPSLETAVLLEVLARDRPVSPDNGPVVGEVAPGLLIAGGHGRGGVLLAPLTALAVRALVDDTAMPPSMATFGPRGPRKEAPR